MYKVYLPLLRVSNNIRTFAALNDTGSGRFIRQTTLSISRKACYIRSRRRQPLLSETASIFVCQYES